MIHDAIHADIMFQVGKTEPFAWFARSQAWATAVRSVCNMKAIAADGWVLDFQDMIVTPLMHMIELVGGLPGFVADADEAGKSSISYHRTLQASFPPAFAEDFG